ncbi:P-loop NTPase fold protein [Polaribacter sp. Q13]|uniref:KAP family P-loop NTPase fold protein n=1 Tax=Polaribacter sp. Q13 TaxID=2806551 RepID=UPI00193B6124|nr:P-loop NTPase fold protein [Polaribacter sp. Q13]QVY67108.1 hypothetical protein JOP69_07500 [Polaribacter sp. Q13]
MSLIFIEKISVLLIKLGKHIITNTYSFEIGYWIISLFFIVLYIALIRKKFIHNKRTTFLVFYVTIIYILLRFIYTQFIDFAPNKSDFKYADIILVLFAAHIINLIVNLDKNIKIKRRKTDDVTNFFIEDKAFDNGEIDNEAILQKLVEVVTDFKPNIAFSIGINAVWGYGKSSFLERFDKEFKKTNNKSVLFWYHIWKNKGSTAIIENFFDELKQSLKPYSSEISEDINNYVSAILSLSSGDLQKIISVGMELLSENSTLEKYHTKINNTIKKIDKQIVILLDDLDRLEKDEILNSLKLIRTLSDFNNVVFIAGYDREYVVKTIEKSKDNYIDKIFNVEINLLPFDQKLIETELLKQIDIAFPINISETDKIGFNYGFKNLFTEKQLNISDVSIDNLHNDNLYVCEKNKLGYKDFLKTYRDVKRFINEFKFNASLSEVEKNVIPDEYILFKLLIYKYRDLPNIVFNKIDELLKKGVLDSENNKIQFLGDLAFNDVYCYDEEVKLKIKNILEGIYPNDDIVIINAALCKLFSEKPQRYYQLNQNSISKIYYTNIYLRNNILGAEITISELQEAFDENNIFSIAERVSKLNSKSKTQLINEIKEFIFNNPINSKESFIDSLESINITLMNQGASVNQRIVKILNDGYVNVYKENKLEFKKEIATVLESKFIGYLDVILQSLLINIEREESGFYNGPEVQKYNDNPLNSDEIIGLLSKKLEDLIAEKLNVKLIFDYYSSIIGKIVIGRIIVLSNEANELIRDDIKNRFKDYLITALFDFMTKPKKESDFVFQLWEPSFFLANIFSKKSTYNELIANPQKGELYKLYLSEGWDNFNHFIQDMDLSNLNLSEPDKKSFLKGKKLLYKFIKNNYKPLTWEQYSVIWNEK